jgi:hypothetical protein
MRLAMRARLPKVHLAVVAVAAVAFAACQDEAPPPAPAASAASAAPTGPVLEGALGEAAADLAKKPAPRASASSGAEGPPPNGMFPPGAADRAHAPLAPPKVELVGKGSEPRLQLRASPPEGKQDAVLVVAVSSGQQQALPPMALRLRIGDEGAAKAKPAAPGAAKPAEGQAAGPAAKAVVAEVTEAAVAGMQPGSIPQQLSDAIGKLKGSKLTWQVGENGPGAVEHQLAKGADEGLDIALEAVEEALGGLLVPTPDEPVGEGATWMVTDRASSMGVDGVRYRLVKVDDVDGDRATLSVQIRKYAANDRLDLPLGPQMASASLDAIDAQGKSRLVLVPRAWLPDTGEVSSHLAASLAPPGGRNPGAQQQRAQVQLEVAAQLRSPAAIAAGAKPGAAPGAAAPAPPAPATAPPAP